MLEFALQLQQAINRYAALDLNYNLNSTFVDLIGKALVPAVVLVIQELV
jgi:hypothetical protein